MRYFLISDDYFRKPRWTLGDIEHIDNWTFIKPLPETMEPATYHLSVSNPGPSADFCYAGYAAAPIVSQAFYKSLTGLAELDEPHHNTVFQPIEIGGDVSGLQWFVMIIETVKDCVDENRSEFEKFTPDDPIRPDKAGEYKTIQNLVIDPAKTDGAHIFRIKGRTKAIVVSEEVKGRLEAAEIDGVVFSDVNGEALTEA